MCHCVDPFTAHAPKQKSFKQGGDQKYYLFTAASDGCLPCVRKLVEEFKIDYTATSNTCRYTALDFATWEVDAARKKGREAPGCMQVLLYFKELELGGGLPLSLQSPPAPTALPELQNADREACILCERPKVCAVTSVFDDMRCVNYRLKHAVHHECLKCVQQLLTLRADPLAVEPGNWSESAMSVATARQAHAVTMSQMLFSVCVPPPPPARTDAPDAV